MFAIFAALGAATTLYAVLLNYKPINDWYTPNYVWLTVVGGNGLILLAILGLCLVDELPIRAFWLAFAANLVGGTPIVVWQLISAARRRAERIRRR